jgi:hypothetical protein
VGPENVRIAIHPGITNKPVPNSILKKMSNGKDKKTSGYVLSVDFSGTIAEHVLQSIHLQQKIGKDA